MDWIALASLALVALTVAASWRRPPLVRQSALLLAGLWALSLLVDHGVSRWAGREACGWADLALDGLAGAWFTFHFARDRLPFWAFVVALTFLTQVLAHVTFADDPVAFSWTVNLMFAWQQLLVLSDRMWARPEAVPGPRQPAGSAAGRVALAPGWRGSMRAAAREEASGQ